MPLENCYLIQITYMYSIDFPGHLKAFVTLASYTGKYPFQTFALKFKFQRRCKIEIILQITGNTVSIF